MCRTDPPCGFESLYARRVALYRFLLSSLVFLFHIQKFRGGMYSVEMMRKTVPLFQSIHITPETKCTKPNQRNILWRGACVLVIPYSAEALNAGKQHNDWTMRKNAVSLLTPTYAVLFSFRQRGSWNESKSNDESRTALSNIRLAHWRNGQARPRARPLLMASVWQLGKCLFQTQKKEKRERERERRRFSVYNTRPAAAAASPSYGL